VKLGVKTAIKPNK